MRAIEHLPPELKQKAAVTLERAFSNDPMFKWMFPERLKRADSLRFLNRIPIEYGLRQGHVTHSDQGLGVAVWSPSDRPLTPSGLLRAGLLAAPFRIGFGEFFKFMGANSVMDRIHKKYVPEPHWYLLIVGVDPTLQGRGVGTELVKEGLQHADEMGTPSYLETSEKRNLAFYERLGFRVLESAQLGKNGPPAWAMRREPGAGT